MHCCRERRIELEKEHEHEKDVAKERLRAVRAEAEAPSDTEEEPWRRPLYTARCAVLQLCTLPEVQMPGLSREENLWYSVEEYQVHV